MAELEEENLEEGEGKKQKAIIQFVTNPVKFGEKDEGQYVVNEDELRSNNITEDIVEVEKVNRKPLSDLYGITPAKEKRELGISNTSNREHRRGFEQILAKQNEKLSIKNEIDFKKVIQDYFQKCESKKQLPTIAGLAYEVRVDRKSLYNEKCIYYEAEGFREILTDALAYIISCWENAAVNTRQGATLGGLIFVMKNYGYSEKQEIDVNVKRVLLDV